MEQLKQKECKVIQMKHPGSYSYSWSAIRHPMKLSSEKTTSKSIHSHKPNMTVARRQAPQHRYIGQDPTVPHLKYGLFQNPKKPYVSRGINKSTIRMSDITESSSDRRDSKKQRNFKNKLEITKQESLKRKTNEQICWKDVRAIQNVQAKLKEEEFSRSIYNRNNQVQPQAASLTDSTKGKPSRHLAVSASTHLDIKPRLHSVSQSYKKYS